MSITELGCYDIYMQKLGINMHRISDFVVAVGSVFHVYFNTIPSLQIWKTRNEDINERIRKLPQQMIKFFKPNLKPDKKYMYRDTKNNFKK